MPLANQFLCETNVQVILRAMFDVVVVAQMKPDSKTHVPKKLYVRLKAKPNMHRNASAVPKELDIVVY